MLVRYMMNSHRLERYVIDIVGNVM
jgi:hypothetical protein